MKKTRRVESGAFDVGTVNVTRVHLPDGLVHRLRQAARRDGVTVGDVFTAASAEACARYGPNSPTPARPDLALGTIVDLRARAARVPPNVFGLFLGFTTGWFTHRYLYDFSKLLRAAAAQRRTSVRRQSAEASQFNLLIGLIIARAMGAKKMVEFYRKRFPLAGGISNVNLTHTWPGDIHPHVITGYTRTSPTGPMMPLVLTPTTLGDRLSLCCTYRTALIEPARVQDMIGSFESRLIRFAGQAF